jgi:hypothetical protein
VPRIYFTLVPLLFGCSGSVAPDQKSSADQAPHTELTLEQWRDVISKTSVPKAGCFQASHPATSWDEVPCVKAPTVPHLREAVTSGLPPATALPPSSGTSAAPIGNGSHLQSVSHGPAVNGGGFSDFMAIVAGNINHVVGTFSDTSGLDTVTDDQHGPGVFTLQINSNLLPSQLACTGHAATCDNRPADCRCWQQFVYDNSVFRGTVFIQYWLLNAGASCPSSGGWTRFQGHCFRNSNATLTTNIAAPDLKYAKLIADADVGGNDVVTFLIGSTAYAASAGDNEFLLAKGWNEVEFNVFGESDGSSANFSSDTTLVAKTFITSHTSVGNMVMGRPTCLSETTTAERNNLGLVGACCPSGGRPASPFGSMAPAFQFTETNRPISAGEPADGPYCLSASIKAGVTWPILPGTAQDIGAGGDTVWIVDSNTHIQKWIPTANTWMSSGRAGASRIAVQADGVPWYVDTSGNIFQRTTNSPTTGSWIQHAGCAHDIGVGTDGSVWVIGCSPVNGGYRIHKWDGTGFVTESAAGGGVRIAVDSTGTPWVVNDAYRVFQRTSTDPTEGGWYMYPGVAGFLNPPKFGAADWF